MPGKHTFKILLALTALVLATGSIPPVYSQEGLTASAVILDDATLKLVLEEVSGQMPFDNAAMMAGYNRIRTAEEMTGTMYEAEYLSKILKGYGLDEVTVESLKRADRPTWWVGHGAELRIVEPESRLLARLSEQPALIIRGSDSVDCKGELVYLDMRDAQKYAENDYTGKIILTPEYPSYFTKVFEKGALGIISYQNSIDPLKNIDQVMFDMSLERGQFKGKAFGFRISTRLGVTLRDRLFQGEKLVLHASTKTASYPWKADTVFAAIRGTDPEKKGLLFTAHLFERPAKIGANDNVSGCVALAEIARTITTLIKNGKIPRPERSIYFLMSEEGSGTAAYFQTHPEFESKILGDINMDMVGESLDENSAFLFIVRPLYSKTTYLDSVAKSFAEYVMSTNVDRHGAYVSNPLERFAMPILEKNGSRQSFRYQLQNYEGGSDHSNFVTSDSNVPAISFVTWPDKWYHTDQDTPDKMDPTQLKRVSFIGTCSALAVASGNPAALESLITETYHDRRKFILDAYNRASSGITHRAEPDAGKAWRDGINNLTQSVRLTQTALGGIRDLAEGKPDTLRYLEDVIAAAGRLLPAYAAELKNWYSVCSARRGLKQELPQSSKDDAAAAEIIPVKTAKVGLGDFLPSSQLFGALNKDMKLQMVVFQTIGARGLMEAFILMDGLRSLGQIRDLLSFEFNTIENVDLIKLAKALETAKLITLGGPR